MKKDSVSNCRVYHWSDILNYLLSKINLSLSWLPSSQKVLFAKAENPNADTSEWESAIDALVYEFYGLTAEEIGVVESV